MYRKLKITELNRISVEEFKEADKLPLVIVLDNVRSLHNIGSVFRTSDAFRVESNLTIPLSPPCVNKVLLVILHYSKQIIETESALITQAISDDCVKL